MRGKYFCAAEIESCYSAAEAYFSTSRDKLYCRHVAVERSEEEVLMAIDPGPMGLDSLENMNAFYSLIFAEDCVQLELFPHHGHGKKLVKENLAFYLKRKSLKDLNNAAVPKMLEKGWGFAIIAPAQQEILLNEEVAVYVDPQGDKASAGFWPAEAGGKKLEMADLQAALAQAGVVHGIDEAALGKFLQEKIPYKQVQVAHYTLPEHGSNGYLTFHFRREFDSRPKEDEFGRVDYRTLDLFESVSAGQLLVTRIPPTAGKPGCSVLGKETAALPGKNVPLPKGKNIRANEEGTELYAMVGGMVAYTDGRVIVSNVYQVEGDADMSVGNIDFDGSVIIRGHVISGLTIKASGNIEIGKVVEAANIISGGNIVLRHGMQGMNKGILEAAGSITAGFIERATIIAGANITANIIAHCSAEAGDSMIINGSKGSLVGGQAQASNMIKARIIGNPTETPTEIGVGFVPHKRYRMQTLQQELSSLPEEIEKLSTILNYLAANPSDDPKRQAMGYSANQSLIHKKELLVNYTQELADLSQECDNAIYGKVHVSDTIYSGVRISIASSIYKVMENTTHCTFKISEGEIAFGVYEG
ncbi:MAG: FapA family protein [Clostridiales bacterium]|nr:FapA family protein [Clostridiales bacterium]